MRRDSEILGVPDNSTRGEIKKAYRALAKRWHPDRFSEGPERDWASEKMAEINSAYRSMLKCPACEPEAEALKRVQSLIEDGKLGSARDMLMKISTRCAEWNYLFGALLFRLCEYEKAKLYLSVAAHQRPEIVKYARAYESAKGACLTGMKQRLRLARRSI